jgi:hypothetical protein
MNKAELRALCANNHVIFLEKEIINIYLFQSQIKWYDMNNSVNKTYKKHLNETQDCYLMNQEKKCVN